MSPGNRAFRTIAAALIVAGALGASEACWAGGSPRAHDGGFFLRLSAGGAGASTSINPGVETKVDGAGGDINFAIGGMVANNLALHGTLLGWTLSEPDLEIGGITGTSSEDFSLSGFAAGITYYAMPANIYFSPNIGVGILSAGNAETDAGLVLDFTIGKEWWVGGNWGLGLAGAFGYHSIPGGGVDENWSGTSFALRFSATLN